MDRIIEPPERLELRTALAKMRRDVQRIAEVGVLDQATLKQHKIRVLPMSLHGDKDLEPRFFTPSSAQQMPDPVESYVEREYDVSDEERHSGRAYTIYTYLEEYLQRLSLEPPFKKTAWSSLQVGDYSQFRNLYQSGPGEFGPYEISHVADESYPHIKVVMYNDMESDDDHLLRGEVLTLIRITLGQLNLKCFVNAMIAPVLLVSLNGNKPRVIEAWFDGRELVVRRTATYDFTHRNYSGMKTLASCVFADYKGVVSKAALATRVHDV